MEAGLSGEVLEGGQVVGHGLGGGRVGALELDELARPGVEGCIGDQGRAEAVVKDGMD